MIIHAPPRSHDVPDWFDDGLVAELLRKRHRSRGLFSFLDATVFKTMELVVRKRNWRFSRAYDWDELEDYLERDCRTIRASGYRPDIVIGIKSGGAFVANYVARLLDAPEVGYVRVERYSPIGGSSFLALLCNYFRPAKLTADDDLDLDGRNVLLVDDQTLTGKSLSVARRWIESRGAVAVKTYCMFTQGYQTDFGNRSGIMLNSPWGDDP